MKLRSRLEIPRITIQPLRRPTQVVDLPVEVLGHVADFLDSFFELYALVKTCRFFKYTFTNSRAKLATSYFVKDGWEYCIPEERLIIPNGIRQVADWAGLTQQNRDELRDAIICDIYRLTEYRSEYYSFRLLFLCKTVARWNLVDLRAMYIARDEVLQPLSQMILDWYLQERQFQLSQAQELGETPDYPWYDSFYYEDDKVEVKIEDEVEEEKGAVEDLQEEDTLWSYVNEDYILDDIESTLWDFILYCELFHHSIDQVSFDLAPGIQPLDAVKPYFRRCGRRSPTDGFILNDWYRSFVNCEGIFSKLSTSQQSILPDCKEPIFHSCLSAPHRTLLIRLTRLQGLDTLRLLVPGNERINTLSISSIKEKVESIALDQVNKRLQLLDKSRCHPSCWTSSKQRCEQCTY